MKLKKLSRFVFSKRDWQQRMDKSVEAKIKIKKLSYLAIVQYVHREQRIFVADLPAWPLSIKKGYRLEISLDEVPKQLEIDILAGHKYLRVKANIAAETIQDLALDNWERA